MLCNPLSKWVIEVPNAISQIQEHFGLVLATACLKSIFSGLRPWAVAGTIFYVMLYLCYAKKNPEDIWHLKKQLPRLAHKHLYWPDGTCLLEWCIKYCLIPTYWVCVWRSHLFILFWQLCFLQSNRAGLPESNISRRDVEINILGDLTHTVASFTYSFPLISSPR